MKQPCRTAPRPFRDRRGIALVLGAFVLVMVFAFAAFTIDVGYICVTKGRLQSAADAASLAAAQLLAEDPDDLTACRNAAKEISAMNLDDNTACLDDAGIEFGVWNSESRTFTSGGDANAVRVTTRRFDSNGSALPLFFAPMIGHDQTDLSAVSIAVIPDEDGGPAFRFLLDDEMFDSDVEDIEDLADSLGENPEDLITDNDDDGFIDIPPGCTLELPTGQVGDEGVFDLTSYEGAFPFQEDTPYTMLDILAEGTALENSIPTQSHWKWFPNPLASRCSPPVPSASSATDGGSESWLRKHKTNRH